MIRDRFKDFIILNSGEKIFPREIEEFYKKVAPINEMCVFTISGMGVDHKSQILWAVIQPDLDGFRKFAEVNLRSVIQERFDNAAPSMPVYKRPKGFTITLEDLPHNFFGRLERYAVKKIYEPRVIAGKEGNPYVYGTLLKDDPLLMESEIGLKILACLKEQSSIGRPILLNDSLELDLGIDSLGRIELALRLELVFRVGIKEKAISGAFTVEDIFLGITTAILEAKEIDPEDLSLSLGPGFWKENLSVVPRKESLDKLELSAGFRAWLFRWSMTATDYLIFKLFFRIKAEGLENVPKEGAYIIYPNHTSFLDGPAIAACLPMRPDFKLFYFVFGPYFFRPFEKSRILWNLVKMVRLIPFDYSTYFLEALRSCYYVLEQGNGLCFFPEGLRSSDGNVREFKRGFGILAKETKAKLIPVAIQGAYEAWPSTANYPKFDPIRVRFGKPLLPEDLEKEGLAMGASNAYNAICVSARRALIALKNQPS